jgi:hypothetical protein
MNLLYIILAVIWGLGFSFILLNFIIISVAYFRGQLDTNPEFTEKPKCPPHEWNYVNNILVCKVCSKNVEQL